MILLETLENRIGSNGWTTWSPSWTNLTVGNGTVTAKYTKIGKTVLYRLSFVLGNTSSVGSSISFSLPVTSVSYTGTATTQVLGRGRILDSGTAAFEAHCVWTSTTTMSVRVLLANATYLTDLGLSSTTPMTWTTGDEIYLQGEYEAA